MATRLVGVEDTNPALPANVVSASADDIAASIAATVAEMRAGVSTTTAATPASAAAVRREYLASAPTGVAATDTANLLADIAAAQTDGRALLLSAGTYVTTPLLHAVTNSFAIEGNRGRTVIQLDASATTHSYLLRLTGSTAGTTVTIKDVVFDGAGVTPTNVGLSATVYLLDRAEACTVIENVEVRNSTTNGIYANDSKAIISDCWVHDVDAVGIVTSGTYATVIADNIVEGCGRNGIRAGDLSGSGSYTGGVTTITGNVIRDIANLPAGTGAYGNGIVAIRPSHVVIANNNIENVEFSFIRSNSADYCVISGNVGKDARETGMYVELGGKYCAVTGNVFTDIDSNGMAITNSEDGMVGCSVTGNLVVNFARDTTGSKRSGIISVHGTVVGNVIDGSGNADAIWAIRPSPPGGTTQPFDVNVGVNQVAGTKYAVGLPASHTTGAKSVSITGVKVWRQDANWSSFFGAVGGSTTDGGTGNNIASAVAAVTYVDACHPAVTVATRPPAMRIGSRLVADGVLYTSTGTAWVSAIPTGALDERVIYKSADETVNNTATLQDDNDLVLAIGANEVWLLHYVIHSQGDTTADFSFDVAVPAGGTARPLTVFGAVTTTATVTLGVATPVAVGAASGSPRATIIETTVINGSTAGNVTLQWTQAVQTVANSTLKAGSYLRATRVA